MAATPLAGRAGAIGLAAGMGAEGFVPGVKPEIAAIAEAPAEANVPGVAFGLAWPAASGATGTGGMTAAESEASPMAQFAGFCGDGVEALAA
jgi:hypothetical protein